MPVFNKTSTNCSSARVVSAGVSTLALSAALLAAPAAPVAAADYHYTAVGNSNWGQLPVGGNSGGFAAPQTLQASDRAIYDLAGTGQSVTYGGTTRNVGQLVFRAPYAGTGFTRPPSATGIFMIHGLDGLGIDSQVDQQITLHERLALGGNQEWRIDSDTGSITQLSYSASSRFLDLGSYMLTLNAVNAGNSFILNNPVTGSGGLIVTGAGTTYLTAANTYSGGTVLAGGTVSVTADNNLGAASGGLTFNGGTLQWGASFDTARSIALMQNNGTLDTKGFNGTLNGVVGGAGGLIKNGAGTLTLTNANTYEGDTLVQAGTLALTGTGSIAASSRVVADGTFDISGTTAGAAAKSLSGLGTVNFGGQTLTLTQANDTFSGQFAGTGDFILTGGYQALTGNSSTFAGASKVRGGALAVNGTLGGAMDVFGGRLQGNGTVGNTINHLGGVIAPGNSIGTLTIGGNYTSNGGALEIEAELGDDSSRTDLLIITGNSILGTEATQIRVINVGGLGDETTGDGIRIVEVQGATSDAGAFVLNGPAIGGAHSYKLFQNGIADPTDGDWYLRAAGLAPTTPVYENYPQVLLGMVAMPTLEQRVGDRRRVALEAGATGQQAIWTRIEAAHGHVEANASTADASYDADTALVQIGVDGQLSETGAGMLVGGLTAQYSRASADIFSNLGNGGNTTDSYGIGANLTWHGASGFYVDAQAQVATLRSNLNAAGVGEIGDGIRGSGYALSLEAGQKIALGDGWSLMPQAQLAYSSIDFDAFTDPFGANVSLRQGDSLKGRLGVAANYDNDTAGRHVYGIANLTYEFLDGTSVAVSGTDLSFEPQRFGGELGLGGAYKWADGKYALHGEAIASTSFEGGYGFKGTIGFTAGL